MTDRPGSDETTTSQNGSEIPSSADSTSPMPLPVQADADEEAGKSSWRTSPEVQQFWEAVKRLPAYAKLATAILRDPEVPKQAKAVLGVGGGYALSPIDLIPGIIPVVGQMDDVYAMLTALQQSLKRMPDHLAQKHLDAVSITRGQIDDDLAAVRALAKLAVVRSVKFGGKALGRFSRAAVKFANNQLERRDARRGETAG